MPKTAIMLCPGPSLAQYVPASKPDIVLAVNRAGLLHPCDVWACGDQPAVEQWREGVRQLNSKLPLLFTSGGAHSHMRDHSPHGEWGDWHQPSVLEFESIFDGTQITYQWTIFTATAALYYLFTQGVTEVAVYGADWGGTRDYDGVEGTGNRSDDRWKLEREVWANLVVMLQARMRVQRMMPCGEGFRHTPTAEEVERMPCPFKAGEDADL